MKTFKDNQGREWSISVDVSAVKRVKSLLDVNLLDIVDGKLLELLVTDPVLLCDIIYCLVKPEADGKDVSDEDFGRAMGGDAIDHATAALMGELVDFFPRGKRQVLGKALEKFRKFEARAVEVAEKRLDSPELDAQFETELASLGGSSGSLPESSGSTRVH